MRFRPGSSLKVLALLASAAALLLTAPAFATPQDNSDQTYSKARVVRLSFVEGDVQIARPEDDGWEKAIANMPIQEGYAIATGRGRAEIEFESGATVRLDENTEIQFNELGLLNGNRLSRMTLSQGSAIFYANLDRNDEFTVLTTGMTVNVPRNSRFRMDVTQKHVNVAVLKGNVSVQTQQGDYKLAKNQALLFDTRGDQNAVVARAADADDFERWAANRDDALIDSRSASLQYVSAPFRYGVGDLSRNGSWIYAAPYGYVWQPWGISAGWSPYYDGRWIYAGGYGWTWVSYEPWGWLPYHYGSWAYLRTGWAWVPGALHHRGWSPGLVVWVNLGGGQYGWCPRNPFYRPGRVYHNVNVVNTVVVNTGTGIINGGRNGRINRPNGVRFVDDDGPRNRNYFGNVDQVRRASIGPDGETRGRRLEGRTETRFDKSEGNIGRAPLGNGAVAGGSAAVGNAGGRNGSIGAGRSFGNDDMDRRGRSTEARPEEGRSKGGIEVERPGGDLRPTQIPRTESPARDYNSNDSSDRGRGRVGGDPNSSVDYDAQRRRYENRPSTRVEGDANRGRTGSDGNIGRPDPGVYTPPPARPDTRSDDSRRGGYAGTPANAEPRNRMPDSRPESRGDSGSRGNIGRTDPPRPSYTPPPAPPPQPRVDPPRPAPAPDRPSGSVGGSRPSPPPRPPTSNFAPRGDSGRGSFGGSMGGRPSSAPRPSASAPSRGSSGSSRPSSSPRGHRN